MNPNKTNPSIVDKIGNDSTYKVVVSFGDEVCLSQKEQLTPNRCRWFKKSPNVGDIRYKYRIAQGIQAHEYSVLHPEKFLCKVYGIREGYIRYHGNDKGKKYGAWLPIEKDEEAPNMRNFTLFPARLSQDNKTGWEVRFKKEVDKSRFNDGGIIITTNKPFIQGSKKNPNREVDSSLLAVLSNRYVKGKVLLINVCTPFNTGTEALFVNTWA